MIMWLIVASSCSECGNEVAVRLTEEEPTDQAKTEVEKKLGGMFCIDTRTYEVELNQTITNTIFQ